MRRRFSWVTPRKNGGRDVKPTTDQRLVPEWRMCVAIPVLLLCIFLAWTAKTISLPCSKFGCCWSDRLVLLLRLG
jgi:hypothetical protein